MRALLRYLHFIQVTNPFIHIYHFDMLSLSVWLDACLTYKNLVYVLAHHKSPIAQWLERPTIIWKVIGSSPVGGSENSFSVYFDLRAFLHYLHLYPSHQSIYQVFGCCVTSIFKVCCSLVQFKVVVFLLLSCSKLNCYITEVCHCFDIVSFLTDSCCVT